MSSSNKIPLNVVQETFAKFPLDVVLFELNRAYCRWHRGDASFNVSILHECEPENPLFYWIVAETARYAITWSLRRRYDSPIHIQHGAELPQSHLEHLMELAVATQLDLPFSSAAALSRLRSDPLLDIAWGDENRS